MNMNWKNIIERAAWTFLEGFLVALPATLSVDMDGAGWKALLVSACMAGLSAVKTMVLELLAERK